MKHTSRERMLDAAETLLREQGLAGAGIQEVVSRSGAPIGSVYYHFPGGKKQLVAEALRIHGEKARRMLGSAFAQEKPFEQLLRAFFQNAAKSFQQQGAQKGCAIGAVLLDLHAEDEALREVCDEILTSWIDSIAPYMPGATPRNRRSFAAAVVCAIEGAFILGRARRSGQPFIDAAQWLIAAAGGRQCDVSRY
jgi:AcrR family transcriptional regulator